MKRVIAQHPVTAKVIFILLAIACLTPFISTPVALLLGIAATQFVGNPFEKQSADTVGWLLKLSVIGLGFGMNATSALQVGKDGFLFTVVSIALTLSLGIILGYYFRIDKKITKLISVGTAICGGSAIAAVSPIIKANQKQISISIGVVFLLNSVALFLFPVIGHLLDLTQTQFGMWSAIAIHDTSSVVGAAAVYGNKALEIATTVKLARALWILPVSLAFAFFSKVSAKKVKIPYFIGLFIVAILLNSYVPWIEAISPYLVLAAKKGLTLCLFLIGAGLTMKSIKAAGVKPLLLAVFIWIFIATLALIVIFKTM